LKLISAQAQALPHDIGRQIAHAKTSPLSEWRIGSREISIAARARFHLGKGDPGTSRAARWHEYRTIAAKIDC
jgi:hypothetical protein